MVLGRDLDSRLSAREAAAVGDWLNQTQFAVHVMRSVVFLGFLSLREDSNICVCAQGPPISQLADAGGNVGSEAGLEPRGGRGEACHCSLPAR